MENLRIELNDNLSINDLVTLKDQGFSVLRSAHVGNLSPYNLALADAGVPLLLVDHNVTGVDKANAPELVLTRLSETRLAFDGFISSRARIADGRFVDEFHVASIKEALPDADIFTNTEYVRRNEDVVAEIAHLAVRHFPASFERVVLSDGRTQKVDGVSSLVDELGILQLSDNPRAEEVRVLLPNFVNIMINFVVEALLSERDVQYHVAGSKMFGSLKSFKTDFDVFYQLLKQQTSFKDQLPDSLAVNIVPGANAVFATTTKYVHELGGVFAQLDESAVSLASLALKRRDIFTNGRSLSVEERSNYAAGFDQKMFEIERRVTEQVERVPGLLAAPEERATITQYDVIKDGGLFVAPQNKDMTLGELAGVKKRLLGLQKRVAGFVILNERLYTE